MGDEVWEDRKWNIEYRPVIFYRFHFERRTCTFINRAAMADIIIYGAYGYTGELIVRRAIEIGLRPLLSGRNATAVEAIAKQHDLPSKACDLADAAGLDALLKGAKVVIHAAGPFIHTARPMMEACIRNGVHYTDITGEIAVFQMAHSLDAKAREKGVMLMSGTGFDIVPSDCLAAHLKSRMPDAESLVMAFHSGGKASRGTSLTVVEGMGMGGAIRENGKLKAVPDAFDIQRFDFGGKHLTAVTIPWGDVFTAYFSTGIPNTRVYMSMPEKMAKGLRMGRWFGWITRSEWFKDRLRNKIKAGKPGPTDAERAKGQMDLTGFVTNAKGEKVTSSIRTPEGYTLTALTAVHIANEVANGNHKPGFQTPSMVYGKDLITKFSDKGFTDAG
jgi:short subunit dehydrogenase-like uncharacterized protein